MKKGYVMTWDAILALVFVFVLLYGFSNLQQNLTYETGFKKLHFVSEDALEVLNKKGVLDRIGEDWAAAANNESSPKWGAAENLTRQYLDSIVPANMGYNLTIDGVGIYSSEDDPASRRPIKADATEITHSTRLLTGFSPDEPTMGTVARAYIAEQMGNVSSFVYFGGFVGQGNITTMVTLPDALDEILSVYIELDAGDNFTLFVNDINCRSFNGLASSSMSANVAQDITIDCGGNFTRGENTIRIAFAGSEISRQYIGGGYIKVVYNATKGSELPPVDTDYRFPAIDGIINLYDSFYIPTNALTNVSAYLHYFVNESLSNVTIFFRVGNATVYESNATGDITVDLDDNNFTDVISHSAMSGKTVPLRLGMRFGNATAVAAGNASDVVLVTDLSGGMEWCAQGQDKSCCSESICKDNVCSCGNGTCAYVHKMWEVNDVTVGGYRWNTTCQENISKKIDIAKNASKVFAETILNTNNNSRVGMVGYSSPLDVNAMNLKIANSDHPSFDMWLTRDPRVNATPYNWWTSDFNFVAYGPVDISVSQTEDIYIGFTIRNDWPYTIAEVNISAYYINESNGGLVFIGNTTFTNIGGNAEQWSGCNDVDSYCTSPMYCYYCNLDGHSYLRPYTKWTIPNDFPVGNYTVVAWIDGMPLSNGVLKECNETDNNATRNLTIVPSSPPDLIIDSLIIKPDDGPITGDIVEIWPNQSALNITASVTNIGQRVATNFSVGFYWDSTLINTTFIERLNSTTMGGNTIVINYIWNHTWPETCNQHYNITAFADSGYNVSEGNELNNNKTVPLVVTIPNLVMNKFWLTYGAPPPDYYGASPTSPCLPETCETWKHGVKLNRTFVGDNLQLGIEVGNNQPVLMNSSFNISFYFFNETTGLLDPLQSENEIEFIALPYVQGGVFMSNMSSGCTKAWNEPWWNSNGWWACPGCMWCFSPVMPFLNWTVPSLANGDYTIVACADSKPAPNGTIRECDETDNCMNITLTVTTIYPPDIVVTDVTIGLNPKVEEQDMVFNITLMNKNESNTGPFEVGLYLGGTRVGNTTVDDLSGGGVTKKVNITWHGSLPENCDEQLSFTVFADDTENVAESNELNNNMTLNVSRPNLMTSNLQLQSCGCTAGGGGCHSQYPGCCSTVTDILPGQSLYFVPIINNTGGYESGTSTLKVYSVTTGGNEIGTLNVKSLAPGEKIGTRCGLTHIRWTVPLSYTAGNYTFMAVADSPGEIYECNETDNQRQINITVWPDLTITDLIITPNYIETGNPVNITAKVKNNGATINSGFNVSFYLNNKTTLIKSKILASLAAGTETNVSINMTAPDIDGTYTIIVWADSGQVIPELYEGNNEKSNPLVIHSISSIPPSAPYNPYLIFLVLLVLILVFIATYHNGIFSPEQTPTLRLAGAITGILLFAVTGGVFAEFISPPELYCGPGGNNTMFNDSLVSYVNLTANDITIDNHIDGLETWAGTCICCGVNEAVGMLANQSNASSSKAVVVMSDGVANVQCPQQGTGDAKQDAINAAQSACNAGIRVYTVAFGSDADEITLRAMACNISMYYNATNAYNLSEAYRTIAQDILVVAGYRSQAVIGNFSANGTASRLFGDSKMSFDYTPSASFGYGEVSAAYTNRLMGCSGNFFVPVYGAEVNSVTVTSYSGVHWTDRLDITNNNSPLNQVVYDLSTSGWDYTLMGDPYHVEIPVHYVAKGQNNITLGTGDSPGQGTGCSQNNSIIVSLRISLPADANYGNPLPRAQGSGNHTIWYTDSITGLPGNITISIGNESDVFDPENDSLDDTFVRLLDALNFVNDANEGVAVAPINCSGTCPGVTCGDGCDGNPIDVRITGNIASDVVHSVNVPSLWGPAEFKLAVWI
ncbi:MAG: hypothetical protein MSIBF_06235 [Candidatus Altiarchaeales archaeon IMC4]|nr:MAG: hypothetical protein MSIBF_06235 [Candidatus Altiarchaeales archaeon IMC4]